MSTQTTLRRPQDTVQDIDLSQRKALSFVEDIELESLDDLLKQQQAKHSSIKQEVRWHPQDMLCRYHGTGFDITDVESRSLKIPISPLRYSLMKLEAL